MEHVLLYPREGADPETVVLMVLLVGRAGPDLPVELRDAALSHSFSSVRHVARDALRFRGIAYSPSDEQPKQSIFYSHTR